MHHRGTEEDEIAQREVFVVQKASFSMQSHPPLCLCGASSPMQTINEYLSIR